jgi:hypothetical protein
LAFFQMGTFSVQVKNGFGQMLLMMKFQVQRWRWAFHGSGVTGKPHG